MAMGKTPKQATTRCPECGARISLPNNVEVHDEVVCPECDADLIVASARPLRLEWADEYDDDDWDEDDDDDWDDDDDEDWDEDGDDDDDF